MAAPTRASAPPGQGPAGPAGRMPPLRGARRSTALLLLPALLVLAVLFAIPLLRVAVQSVTEPKAGLGNYISLFTDGYTLRVLGRTVVIALFVTVAGLVLAYPYAYAMTIV